MAAHASRTVARSARHHHVGPRHQPRHHRAARTRGPAAAFAEDGGDRPARRRHRARLQQHPDDHPGLRADPARRRQRRRRAQDRDPVHRRGVRARRHPDAAAACVRPPPGDADAAGRSERARDQPGEHGAPRARRGHQPAAAAVAAPGGHQRRPRIDRPGGDEPGDQRARRHAGRRTAPGGHPDAQLAGGRPGDHPGRRHRHRHSGGSTHADLRSVLHDEGRRERHGPGPGDGVRHRRATRRTDRGVEHGGPRHHVRGDAAAVEEGRNPRAAAVDQPAPARRQRNHSPGRRRARGAGVDEGGAGARRLPGDRRRPRSRRLEGVAR